jgi:hypothetical protein
MNLSDLVLMWGALCCSGYNADNYSYADFIGQNIRDFCPQNDVQHLTKHHEQGNTHLSTRLFNILNHGA